MYGDSGPADPIIFCQLPVEETSQLKPLADGMLPATYGEGARLVFLDTDGSTRVLTDGFSTACDPDVSFDGKRILFAGKRLPDDTWNIWEIDLETNHTRQVTHESLDARSPLYLSTLYTITSTEPWYILLFVRQDGTLSENGSAPSTSLYTVRVDGSELRRITFNPSNESDPYLMQDGRLIFSGWNARASADLPSGRISLFGVNTDGIDYALYGGEQGVRIQSMPTVTTDERVVFVESDRVGWDGAGHLATLDRRRPHHSYRQLTRDGDGLFHSPAPLADGAVLVSMRPSDGPGSHALYRFEPGSGEIAAIYDDPDYHEIHAKPVLPRVVPDGRSSTVRPESPTGKLYGLNAYESNTGLEAHLEPGEIHRIRVIEGVPAPLPDALENRDSSQAEEPVRFRRRILGEVPVESDGSFHFDLPTDTPVQLQTLNKQGMALETCAWIWVKPREFRGCIGCHEDPELTPENRFVKAAGRPADELTPTPDERRTVTFTQQIAPILATRCTQCHDSSGNRIALTGESVPTRSVFDRLVRSGNTPSSGIPLVAPGSARTSPLIWMFYGENLSRPWDTSPSTEFQVPTGHTNLLSPGELKTFVEWIDLGAEWSSARALASPVGEDAQ